MVYVFDAEEVGQGGVLALDGEVHLPGHAAVAEVAGGAGAQLGDVLRLGEVHLEEAADARGQRQQVERGLRGLGWLSFGIGIVSWLVLTSLTLNRLVFVTMLPAALMPTVIFEAAPAALAGTAYFELHGPVPDPAVYGITGYLVLMVLVQLRLLPIYGRLKFTP